MTTSCIRLIAFGHRSVFAIIQFRGSLSLSSQPDYDGNNERGAKREIEMGFFSPNINTGHVAGLQEMSSQPKFKTKQCASLHYDTHSGVTIMLYGNGVIVQICSGATSFGER